MEIRKTPEYYRLKLDDRQFFLRGMPLAHIREAAPKINFHNLKAKEIVSATQQKKIYDELPESPTSANLAIFCSHPNDRAALSSVCDILKQNHYQKPGQTHWRFVSPLQNIWDHASDPSDLYVLMGAHQDDQDLTNRCRRWIRGAHGAAVWVTVTAKDPYEWSLERLGIHPDFIFYVKGATRAVG